MPQAEEKLVIAKAEDFIGLLPKMANRHGLIAGATGTGKTVSLRFRQAFSRIGVPVFMADVKGDLSGLIKPGGDKPKVAERVDTLGLKNFQFRAYPVVFWDVDGVQGHPVRTTISDMGPLLLGRLLNLNDTQSGRFNSGLQGCRQQRAALARPQGLARHVAVRRRPRRPGQDAVRERLSTTASAPSSAASGARAGRGGDQSFGEPALNLDDLMQTDANGHGVVNILAADQLLQSPKVYSTLLLWLLSELFDQLPEVGDPANPNWCLLR